MDYKITGCDGLIAVRWRVTPTAKTFENFWRNVKPLLVSAVPAAHLLLVLGPHTGLPDEAARLAAKRVMGELTPLVASVRIVLEGDSMLVSLKRTVARAISVLASEKDFVFHSALEEALAALEQSFPGTVRNRDKLLRGLAAE